LLATAHFTSRAASGARSAHARRPGSFRRLALFPVPAAAAAPSVAPAGRLLPLPAAASNRPLVLNVPFWALVALTASLVLLSGVTLAQAAHKVRLVRAAAPTTEAPLLEVDAPMSVVPPELPFSEVTVAAPEVRLEAHTHAPTVADLLAELGIGLGPLDRVDPPVAAAPPAGGTVRVVRVREEAEHELRLIPFQSRTEYSAEVAPGGRFRVRAGIPGLLERLVHVVYEDDSEIQRTPLSDRVVRAAVDEVVAIARPGVPALTQLPPLPVVAALPALPASGVPELPVRRTLTMVATAYDPGPASTGKSPGHPAYGITATGMRATYGVVAVDPRVIPFYTRLYIPGYGYAIAADTGGDIQGNRIDLFYPTYAEAIQWGRRTVPVYILE